ncbi:MAG TPA: amidohydrolase family protein, partial [Acidimicrobiia bacterium]|nr:amidohydrolase family protein [Acidimicrobiia bacterium]
MTTYDLAITGGTVVDGTGVPARRADIGIKDGRITTVGALDGGATRTIDATDLIVAPGFVDLHTHYDAQLLWDPSASPSPMHGVTTVFGGNCGFTLAPGSPEHVDYLSRLMARVEGIPLPALQEGVPWDWKSFGDYLDRVEAGGAAVNAGFLCGHSALRRVVMGEHAVGNAATDKHLDAMERLLHDALGAGALGFSSSQAPTHNDGNGDPVPSRAATANEMIRLAAALHDHPGTQLELIIPGCLNGFTDDEVEMMSAMSIAADRPLNWNVLGVAAGGNHEHQLEAGTKAAQRGARVVALTLPQGMRIRLSFLTGFVLDG